MAGVFLPVTAAQTETYANQTINDEFVVQLPPEWSNFPVNSYAGQAIGVMDNNDISNVITIKIYQNMNCSSSMEEKLRVNLNDFNAQAGIAALSDPDFGNDSVAQYGKYSDGKISHLFLRLIGGNVVAVFGSYDTMDIAKEHASEFTTIASSVIPLHEAVQDHCAEATKTASVVPTGNNTRATPVQS